MLIPSKFCRESYVHRLTGCLGRSAIFALDSFSREVSTLSPSILRTANYLNLFTNVTPIYLFPYLISRFSFPPLDTLSLSSSLDSHLFSYLKLFLGALAGLGANLAQRSRVRAGANGSGREGLGSDRPRARK
jgi:hypothetical protein